MRPATCLAVFLALSPLASPTVAAGQEWETYGDFIVDYVLRDAVSGADRTTMWTSAVGESLFRGPALSWGCNGPDQLRIGVLTHEFIRTDSIRVMYHFDSDPPFGPVYWEPSTNGTGAIPPAARMEIMTKRALTAERLRVRMWKSDDTPVDLEFSLNGFAEGIRMLPCASGVVTDSLP